MTRTISMPLMSLPALALVLAACEALPSDEGATATPTALTAEAEPEATPPAGDCGCGRFVDEDGDGVCDLIASGECRRGEDGRCACGREVGDAGAGGHHGCGRHGQGFVDEDGDGRCDHMGEGGCGCGRHGQGFVDEDGDGRCDHMGERGCGCGRHRVQD